MVEADSADVVEADSADVVAVEADNDDGVAPSPYGGDVPIQSVCAVPASVILPSANCQDLH